MWILLNKIYIFYTTWKYSLENDIENTYYEILKLKIPLKLKTNDVKNNEISKHTIKRKISDFLEIWIFRLKENGKKIYYQQFHIYC